jgi:hypothetical protein
MSEENLMDRVRDRDDREAYQELYQRRSDQLYVFTLLRVRNRDQAEEVSQETWWRVWRSRHSWRLRTTFWAWLRGIASRTAITLQPPHPPQWARPGSGSDVDSDIVDMAELMIVALRNRPEPERDQAVISLRHFVFRESGATVPRPQSGSPEEELHRILANPGLPARPSPRLAEQMFCGVLDPPRTIAEVARRRGLAIGTVHKICKRYWRECFRGGDS